MARTVVGSAVVVRQKYYWPDTQLNIWTIIMLVTAGLILGVNAQFMTIQNTMRLGIPWYVPPLYSLDRYPASPENASLTIPIGSCPTVLPSAP